MLSRYSNIILALLSAAVLPGCSGVQINVTVGGIGVLQYNPEFVTATPGDTVVFNFLQENHTATQSTFDAPCEAVEGGFDSGFVPVLDNNTAGPFPAALFSVTDINPVWVYCRQANHCQSGMVFAINPGNQFAAFKAKAMGISLNATSSSASASSTSPPSASAVPTTFSIVSVTTSSGIATTTATATTEAYSSNPPAATPTAISSSDHVIIVGGQGTLTFSPSNITAEVGDTITFQFQQKNHTATQSSFADPCTSLTETSTSGQIGFDSGFMPVVDGAAAFPSFTIQVNDTAPIWAYCRQTNPSSHCAAGMVFSANAVKSGANDFAAFQARAMQTNTSGVTASSASSSSTGAISAMRPDAGIMFIGIAIVIGAFL